jgi:hypothetical protein
MRRHYVDIYVKSENKCIEVKSTWTFEKNRYINRYIIISSTKKQQAGKDLGYKYEIWVYDAYNAKGSKIQNIM